MSKDYGEHIRLADASELHHEMSGKVVIHSNGDCFTTYEDYDDFLQDHKDFIDREIACTNSCQGVPDEALKGQGMAKAWLAWKLVEWTKEMDIYEPFQNQREPIDIALDFRKHGQDFGELNALIDSFKEEV